MMLLVDDVYWEMDSDSLLANDAQIFKTSTFDYPDQPTDPFRNWSILGNLSKKIDFFVVAVSITLLVQ